MTPPDDLLAAPVSRRRRPRARLAVLGLATVLLLPLLGACTPTTNNPSSYDTTTEANVLDGCVQAQAAAEGTTVDQITVDDNDTSDDRDDVLVVPETISPTLLDPCRCLYDGIVENISFDTFTSIDSDLENALEKAGESGTDTTDTTAADGTTTTLLPAAFTDIVADCFPT